MSTLRKLERQVIKNQLYNKNHNYSGFYEAWDEYRTKKHTAEDGEVCIPKDTMKKKRFFNDNKDHMIQSVKNMFNIKQKIQSLIDAKLNKAEVIEE